MGSSAIGRVGCASGCPTIGAGIVSPAAIQVVAVVISAPNDHLTASPHRCVKCSASGGVGEASRSPRVVRAGAQRSSYYRKGVARAHCRHYHRHLRFGFGQPRSQRFFQPRDCGEFQPVFALLRYRHRVVMAIVFLERAQYAGLNLG